MDFTVMVWEARGMCCAFPNNISMVCIEFSDKNQ